MVICILQTIKPVSITYGKPTMLFPIIFVMSVSMIKDFIEDWTRQRSDKVENNSKVHKESMGDPVKWGSLGLGDLIVIHENE